MDEDRLNLETRKFLKKVGISSQRMIEKAVYSGIEGKKIESGDKIKVSMTLNIEKLGVNYKIEDDLNL
ncbi:MAG: hypothetical protein CFH21_00371 [Alphaproteobacteria bacterium MarineAlpha5_Bin11]|nr:hypothetical protein [Pelagibacteraceae bacterium]PPR44371.1 MAG: hypothetical protein CFH21_00371 [Alphaproteobacteria bacterium MarineAlpha5_Bin11]PPR51490.1 MAG: hypothetical protein CFH20_00556 [Alphaproteobacteria bacterium MarineAlpha5_Bin10]|tara:strand:- start:8262 stop:8465 length:204 start_codon:yes stop_codon:yes gene_type:complete